MWVWWLTSCGGSEDGLDSAGPTEKAYDSSMEGLARFVSEGSYQQWTAETAAPRERNNEVSPHDRVRVWGNDVLLASQESGNGAFGGTAHDVDSMVVKELYDSADVLLGHAVMLKVDAGLKDWAYYCAGPPAQCGVPEGDQPYYVVGTHAQCSYCHAGLVFNGF